MKTYDKRIAFVLAKQHLIAHGGLGQFALGFARMCRELNWKVDIITDQPERDTPFIERLAEEGVTNIISPKNPLPYTAHAGTFAFSDSMNFEKMANFRSAMMHAFETNLYDCIVCNTYESVPAIYALDLGKSIPIVYYTHNEFMVFKASRKVKNVFTDAFNQFFLKLMEVPGLYVGTQTERNREEFNIPTARCLPMPMPEAGLLELYDGPREGVLFIGRWEPGKQPTEFLEVIAECRLPARILTNANGAKKFEEWFKDNKITDYKIGVGLTGQEKVDFIRSCKVHLNTSLRECYPFAFFECLGHMPCVVRTQAEWRKNFYSGMYRAVEDKDLAQTVLELYGLTENRTARQERLNEIIHLDRMALDNWNLFLTKQFRNATGSSGSRISNFTGRYASFIQDLNRTQLAVDDLKPVYACWGKFRVIYTDAHTYLATTSDFVPDETGGSLEDLFA